MSTEAKRKIRNIACIYLFFILVWLIILGLYKLRQYMEHLEQMRRSEAYMFSYEGYFKHNIAKLVDGKLEFTNHKGEVYIIEDDIDLKKIDEEEEAYIEHKINKFGEFQIIEGEDTPEKIANFNNNMTHIKVWNDVDKEYKTISESEKLYEFKEISDLDGLIIYMGQTSEKGVENIDELDIVGHDRTRSPTKIIYDYGNGEEKVLKEKDNLYIRDLFKDNSK